MKKTTLFRWFGHILGRIWGNKFGVLQGKCFFRQHIKTFIFLNLSVFLLAFQASAAHTMTANGNAQIDTAQSKFGGASGLFDGTGDFVDTPDSTDWDLGSGEFGYATQVRINAYSDTNLLTQGASPNFAYAPTIINSGGSFNFYYTTDGSTVLACQTVTSLSLATWYHLEVDRSGNNLMIFVDGTQVGSTCDFTGITLFNSTANLTAEANGFNGWQDETILIKGTFLHNANFTPPVSAYTCGQPATTKLLLHMDGTDTSTTFTDDSTTACAAPAGKPQIMSPIINSSDD